MVNRTFLILLCFAATFSSQAQYTFSLMSYNLLNYPGSTASTRNPAFRTIMSSANPDILVVQEIGVPTGFTDFLNNVLNYSSTVYEAGTFTNGPDSDNGIYFKPDLFSFVSNTPIRTALRDINEFKLRHTASGDTLVIYSVHLKSSNTSADQADRAAETDSLRKVTNRHPATRNFIVCGDFNIYKSSEQCYSNLTQTGANTNGRFYDVINMSGTWNNATYAAYHTQSPRTASFGGGATGGLDDRFDLILFSGAIYNPGGLDIVANSYKAYGNDGAHFNAGLDVGPYTTYSQTLLTALHDASDHIPVMVSLVYNSPLPVKLLYVTSHFEHGIPVLRWATATENNSDYFIVQRSDDAQTWKDIDRIKAASNSSSTKTYSYTDRNSVTGNTTLYYRLKQVDLDKQESFSTVVTLNASLHIEEEMSVFPNPSTSVFSITFTHPGDHKLQVFDLDGKLVKELQTGIDQRSAELNLSGIAQGIYYIKRQGSQGQVKVVKL